MHGEEGCWVGCTKIRGNLNIDTHKIAQLEEPFICLCVCVKEDER